MAKLQEAIARTELQERIKLANLQPSTNIRKQAFVPALVNAGKAVMPIAGKVVGSAAGKVIGSMPFQIGGSIAGDTVSGMSQSADGTYKGLGKVTNVAGQTLSGAANGAMYGGLVGSVVPVIGNAVGVGVGAGIGGVIGAVNGIRSNRAVNNQAGAQPNMV